MIYNTNYTEKSYDDIFQESVEYAQELGLLSDDPDIISNLNKLEDIENIKVLDLSVHSNLDSILYKDMTRIYDSWDIDKATGVDLDRLGAFFSITRPPALRSIAGLVFTLTNTVNYDITIPEGTVVSTDAGEDYITIETVKIPAGADTVNVSAKSVLAGYNSRVGKNTLVNIVSSFSLKNTRLTVNNPEHTSGGRDICSDDKYREMIKDWHNILTRGTASAYENYFENYESIEGYRLIPHWDGPGTLKIVVDAPTESLAYIIREVGTELAKSVNMYSDDDVIIVPPRNIVINNVFVSCNVDIDQVNIYSTPDKDNIRLRISNAIETYIDGGFRANGEYYPGLGIGEDFIPHKCAVFIDSEIPELKNIIFHNEENTVINDFEKAVCGTVTITME